jgi:membrane-bound lytic murein transglycosylase B
MARSEQDDPLDLKGSFAGAMGYGQFMPSSYKQYAVDFNGDGHINLWDPVDAIGSVANYFKQHGWVSGDLVAVQALGQAPGLENGFKTNYSVSQLAAAGLTPTQRWATISRPACCVWISAPVISTGTVCRTSTPSPAITTAPTTRWPSGSWVWRFLRPADSNPSPILPSMRGVLLHFAAFPAVDADLHFCADLILLRYNILIG